MFVQEVDDVSSHWMMYKEFYLNLVQEKEVLLVFCFGRWLFWRRKHFSNCIVVGIRIRLGKDLVKGFFFK